MASIKKQQNKSGKIFYEIRCHIDRDRSILSKRWYPPDGWSQKAIDRELRKVAAEFEQQCKAKEVLSKTETAAKIAQEEAEAAKILTVRQYGEQVFIPAMTVRCSSNTISSFQGNLDNHIYPVLGDYKMPAVTSAQLTSLLLNIQNTGKAHGTVVKIYTVLKGVQDGLHGGHCGKEPHGQGGASQAPQGRGNSGEHACLHRGGGSPHLPVSQSGVIEMAALHPYHG